ncbi:MAG: SDR family oxidoreductase [Proteobacteria bacterium]|nr:SDR family oxidoreductase [Pseudomonadota bacterium]
MTTVNALINLKGRRALITGAAGSLGKIMTQTLAELGADLVLLDHPDAPLAELATQIAAQWGVDVAVRLCDLESEAARDTLINELVQESRLDVLINNAAFVGTSGLQGWGVPFAEQSIETWRRALEVNLTAAFHLCQGLAPMLQASGYGSIINIGSIYGEYGPDWSLYEGTSMSNPAAYGASKGGLLQLTRWLATTIAPNVRVNAVSPGGVFRDQNPKFVERYVSKTPLKRMATEDDFRGVIAFLASDLSSYVTGQNIAVDGGWGVW